MPIDLTNNVAFIHVPRTGGRSIAKILRINTPESLFSHAPLPHLFPADKTPQHFTLRELQRNVGTVVLDRCFRFAFVRNPWDRFVSEYLWRRAWCFKSPRAESDYFYRPQDIESLDAFVRVLDLPEEQRIHAQRGFDGHLETQLSFILDDAGKRGVDFLGRFESFEADVRWVARRVGTRLGKIPQVGRSDRDRDHRRYHSAYSRSAVESFYKDDIREFGYTF